MFKKYFSYFKVFLKRILPNSKIKNFGLKENEDYILGSPRFYYKNINEFFTNLKKLHKMCSDSGKVFKLPLIVFNVKNLFVRKIVIEMEKEKFFLGVKIGVGIFDNICLILNQSKS